MIKKSLLTISLCVLFNLVAANVANSPALVLTHPELNELDLSKELVLNDRLDMMVLSDNTSTDFYVDLSNRLSELGWSISWADIQEAQNIEEFIASFYKHGGKHLRLEVSDIGNDAYKVFAYQY